tara:strand:+ start:47 stop:178 length:132 start_codon:yes stop_codon:yes gene_type:complete
MLAKQRTHTKKWKNQNDKFVMPNKEAIKTAGVVVAALALFLAV